MTSKESDERYTPPNVLAVIREFAPIAYDPCSPSHNPTDAESYCVAQIDGRAQSWSRYSGLIYCNPPFSRGQLARWCDKAVRESVRGCEIVVLTPADPSTRWSVQLFHSAQAVAFWRGRIQFGAPGRPTGIGAGAKQPNAFWYFGERAGRFARVFAPHATVVHLDNRVAFAVAEAAP